MVIYLKNFILSVIVQYMLMTHNFSYLFEVYRLVGVRYCVICGLCVCSRYAVLMLRGFLQGIWILFVHLIRSTRLKHKQTTVAEKQDSAFSLT